MCYHDMPRDRSPWPARPEEIGETAGNIFLLLLAVVLVVAAGTLVEAMPWIRGR